MQKLITTAARLGTLALIGLTAVARGQESIHLVAGPASKLSIDGGSNLHSWSCKVTAVDATVDADAALTKAGSPLLSKLVQHVQINIPISTIACGEGAMDKNLAKALKAESVPIIRYRMTTIEPVGAVAGDSVTMRATGQLAVAGVEKAITTNLVATRLADGSLRVIGNVPLLMTDFGVKPPTAILGTLRTKNDITVRFELVVGPAVAPR